MAYLLLAPTPEAKGKRENFGLTSVWVYPRQNLLSSMEEAMKKVTLFISSGEGHYYALVSISKDTRYLPLSDAAHISMLVGGAPGKSAYGYVSQLGVCQLLCSGGTVVYPVGLNGGLKPLRAVFPKIPPWEMGATQESTYLRIALRGSSKGKSPTAAPCRNLLQILPLTR